MSKRPSVIGGLTLPGSETREPAPSADAAPAAPPLSVAALKPVGRRARPDVVHTSVYLPREVHRRLREIAFTRDVKVHDVIMEGIDAALQKHGHPPVASLKLKGEA
ncbi:hypothetical protein [Methylobacterium sp. J-070]|uniref:hypothetical protein n=1 Tax=Methylobacterium sp. J-070 TaxID=2836650 RepID=UPI001FBBECCC|nr:hypothetical protein [Methylobacterium sp. J-070]MCJ2049491.1 hypothetical protein [Methylobacterium sp. J-070]